MQKRMLIILPVLLSQLAFAQKHEVQAIYFNDKNVPYKIETKYTAPNAVTYVCHHNDGSICLKRNIVHINDTVIVSETYYDVIYKKTKFEKFRDCDLWKYVRKELNDSLYVMGYQWQTDSMRFIGDTVFNIADRNNPKDFLEAIKTARVPMILDNKITVPLDSLVPLETSKVYYLHNNPVKIETFDAAMKMTNLDICRLEGNQLTAKHFFIRDSIENYELDTYTWNDDTTKIHASLNRYEWKKIFSTMYKIDKATLKVKSKRSFSSKIEFLEPANIFQNILIDDLVYNDVLYRIEFRYFDRQKIISKRTKRGFEEHKYTYDDISRIIGQSVFYNGKLEKKIVYSYIE
ncbi:MAG: hypothetical protein QM737_01085 [Ferruginibacter sp.]